MMIDVGIKEPLNKTYLVDAVYAEFDGYHIILTTSDGVSVTNRIYLDPDVVCLLERYIQTIRRKESEEIPK